MKYLKITNKGELDARIVSLMGATNKSGNYDKIGHFGTGLKYTMAYLLRNNIDLKIFSGEKEIKIETKEETIAGTTYDIIYIDGEKTSITTNMGTDWEAWMIIREIWSNAVDEGDPYRGITEDLDSRYGYTTIYIELTIDILEIYNNWDKYFITNAVPIYVSDTVDIYPSNGQLRLYKQGILVQTNPTDSVFNYDIKNARLNELREYQGLMESDIMEALVNITDVKTIKYFLEHVTEGHYEGKNVDYAYSWYNKNFNHVWREILKDTKIIHAKALKRLIDRGIKVDPDTYMTVPEPLYKGLTKHFKDVGALMVSKTVEDFFEIHNDTLHDKILKAKNALDIAGYYMDPELSFVYGIFGDKNMFAKTDVEKKKIYISEKYLDSAMFSICTMLVEENEHYKTRFEYVTKKSQQHFINLYVSSIVDESRVNLLD